MDTIDGISDMPINQRNTAVLTLPIDTGVRCVKDRAITADNPPFIIADEEDLFIVIDHSVALTCEAIALFPPRFTAGFGVKNSIMGTDNPPHRIINEPDSVEHKLADVLVPFPLFSTILGVEDIRIFPNNPPLF